MRELAIAPEAPIFSAKWIIGAKPDLLWFIGSAFSAYVFLFLALRTGQPALVWLLWAMLLDTPHYFGTYSRTFLDPEMRARHRTRIFASLGFAALGPFFVGVSALVYKADPASFYRLPMIGFTLAFNVWAFWHLVRQHYGLMSLYKRRNQDSSLLDRVIDDAFLYGGLFASFVILAMQHPEARASLGLPAVADSGSWASWDQILLGLAWLVIGVTWLVFVGRQVVLRVDGHPINLPKVLFLVSVVASYVCVVSYTPGYVLPLLFWTGCITIAHNFQYQAIVWFFHRNRLRSGVPIGTGWSAKVRSSLPLYLLAATATGVGLRVLGTSFEVFPGLPVLVGTKTVVLFGDVTLQDFLFMFMLGFAMNHYYLDQIIWRPSKDASLRTSLRLETA